MPNGQAHAIWSAAGRDHDAPPGIRACLIRRAIPRSIPYRAIREPILAAVRDLNVLDDVVVRGIAEHVNSFDRCRARAGLRIDLETEPGSTGPHDTVERKIPAPGEPPALKDCLPVTHRVGPAR